MLDLYQGLCMHSSRNLSETTPTPDYLEMILRKEHAHSGSPIVAMRVGARPHDVFDDELWASSATNSGGPVCDLHQDHGDRSRPTAPTMCHTDHVEHRNQLAEISTARTCMASHQPRICGRAVHRSARSHTACVPRLQAAVYLSKGCGQLD